MKIIFTILTIVISIPAISQNHIIGLKGGTNWTNVQSTNLPHNNGNRTGFHSGITYDYRVNKRVKLGTDVLYLQKGYTNDVIFTDRLGNPTGERVTIDYKYDYLSLPLKCGIVIEDEFSGFINLGIVPSFLVDAKTTAPAIEGLAEETTFNVTDRVTKFDLGGLIEMGANYSLTPDFLLSATIGYQHSFTSIANENYFPEAAIRHYGIALSVGVAYALKKE